MAGNPETWNASVEEEFSNFGNQELFIDHRDMRRVGVLEDVDIKKRDGEVP